MQGSTRSTEALPVIGYFKSIVILFLVLLTASAAPAQRLASNPASPAQESERAAEVRALNNTLLQLHGQLQENQAGAAGVRDQAAAVLAQRAAALQELIKAEPRAALSFAFTSNLLADLAQKFPQSASLLESHVTVSGQLEQWVEDDVDPKASHSYFLLNAGGKTLTLHFAGKVPTVKPSELLQASGVVVGSDMAVSSARTLARSGVFGLRPGDWQGPLLMLLLCCVAIALFRFRVAIRGTAITIHLPGLLRACAAGAMALFVTLFNPTASSAQTTCSSMGVQNVAVLLVTFPGVALPTNITPQNVYDMFFSTTGPSLDGYWREASYGQTSATGNVFGPYTLASSYANCSALSTLRDAAITAAANAGVNFQNYSRVFIVTPDFGCGWTGLAINGCTTLSSPTGSFVASSAFLDASWQRSQTEGAENAAHEGGHGMGLGHAQSRTFGTEPLGPLGSAGTITEYGDPFSDMSASNIGHYATPQKAEILKWISSGNYQVVQGSGTWTLQPLEINPAGLVALKVQRGTGNNAWLWIEYRQALGYDSNIWPPTGALIHYEDSSTGTHTQLLDFTPATANMYDAALVPGNTWTDPYSNVSITIQSATPSGLTVSVNYGAAPCTSSAPSVAVSPPNPSIYAGQSASYSVSVTNNDSSGCAASTINLASSAPSGWSTSLSSSSVTLSPGQSASVTMGKGAPSGTPAGTYAVSLTGSNSSATGAGTANATVMTAPSLAVTLSVSGASFTVPGTVPITATVSSGGVAVSGASVIFTVTAPNGGTATQTATADSNGVASWNYKLNGKSPAGTYSVTAQAGLSSGSKKTASTIAATSNTVSFMVQ